MELPKKPRSSRRGEVKTIGKCHACNVGQLQLVLDEEKRKRWECGNCGMVMEATPADESNTEEKVKVSSY